MTLDLLDHLDWMDCLDLMEKKEIEDSQVKVEPRVSQEMFQKRDRREKLVHLVSEELTVDPVLMVSQDLREMLVCQGMIE